MQKYFETKPNCPHMFRQTSSQTRPANPTRDVAFKVSVSLKVIPFFLIFLKIPGASFCSDYRVQNYEFKIMIKVGLSYILAQWSKWPKFVTFQYWNAPRGVKNSWQPTWHVWVLRFSQNWRNCGKPSKLNKNCQRNPVFWRFFEFYKIWAES